MFLPSKCLARLLVLLGALAMFYFCSAAEVPDAPATRRVAAVVTEYRHNSHADVIVSRLLLTHTLDGQGTNSHLRLVSLYTDQRPPNDISRLLAASHRFRIAPTIDDALTLGTGRLSVDGVLLVAEHGNYPKSRTGNTEYPKRRFWEEIVRVFRASGRVVPVFIDKHLADNWAEAKALYDTARELGIPIMAGSSVPGSWRRPAVDVARGTKLEGFVGITFGATDAYGFHALECLQSIVEQRAGGETGVRSVQMLTNGAVWRAVDETLVDSALFEAALSRLTQAGKVPARMRELAAAPKLFRIEYNDGLKADLFELNGYANEWTGAWRQADGGRIDSTQFWTQEGRPAAHFNLLVQGIQELVFTGKAPWNVERTLLTSGMLDAAMLSMVKGQRRVETPYMKVVYQPVWRWADPPPPPAMRPWSEQ